MITLLTASTLYKQQTNFFPILFGLSLPSSRFVIAFDLLPAMLGSKKVMFVCKANSCRSQMAEGFGVSIGMPHGIEVQSCGLRQTSINQQAVTVMKDAGIDISSQQSQSIDSFNPEDFDVVISMCGCGVTLPLPWKERPIFRDWNLDDPPALVASEPGVFVRVRDEIKQLVDALVTELSTSS